MAKFTDGPWKADGCGYVLACNEAMLVCEMRGLGHLVASGLTAKQALEIQDANAALIAAVPLLLDACRKAYKELNEIRARDGVPYTHYGMKASVCPDYFSSVVDDCQTALKSAGVAT